MEAAGSSETLVTIYHNVRRRIPEGCNFQFANEVVTLKTNLIKNTVPIIIWTDKGKVVPVLN
jgi:hypothetical protein